MCWPLRPCVALLLAVGLQRIHSFCEPRVRKIAYSSPLTYTFPSSLTPWGGKLDSGYYEDNLKCEVLIYSIWAADGVRLAFDWTDLEPPERPGDYSTCRDKIVVYDGDSVYHRKLLTVCGDRTPTITSSSRHVLLVFTSDSEKSRKHRGFSITYQLFQKERYDTESDTDNSSTLGRGTLTAIILPVVVVFACLTRIAYKKCTSDNEEDDSPCLRDDSGNHAASSRQQDDVDGATMSNLLYQHPSGGDRGVRNEIRMVNLYGRGDGSDGTQGNTHRQPAGEYSGRVSPYYPQHGSAHGSPVLRDPALLSTYHLYNQRQSLEDDRWSHGSGRSRRSRRTSRGDNPPIFTYYGDVDEVPDPAYQASAPRYDEVVLPGQNIPEIPPPSYEEAATGKYDPPKPT